MAVRIRMKRMGRKNRPYYRIVAIDSRQPRDGRELELLGTYDPSIRETDNRVTLQPERVKHWIKVGALPSENVQILINKYMKKFEDAAAQATAPAPTA